ncbi:MAG: glycosyltransferase family 1 protein [Rhodocyclaceae bacterium]|nr:glycosyltransferase family 1 protein [Rhodocyclaceae bacterium]
MEAQNRNPPLTVALVTETYPPEVNGVAMTLGRLASGLRQRGHRVQVVRPRQRNEAKIRVTCTDEMADFLVPGLPIPFYPGLRFGLPNADTLIHHWRRQRPDIVHIATEGPLGSSALTAARRLGLPVSSGFHTNFDAYCHHYGIAWLRRPIAAHLRGFHNRTDATMAPTQALANELRRGGYQNVNVVSRGVDVSLFHPGRRTEALREQWGAGPGDLVAIYVGRLAPEKNLGLAIRAFEAVHRQQPGARMVFVGDGPARAGLAARHRDPAYIFCGARHGEDLAAHYASADIFLFPSLTETFGNVTVEALASGLGVVAYDCAAASDLIENDRNGCLAPPGDEAAFIAAAEHLAGQPQLLAQIRNLAQAAVAHLAWDRVHEHFASLLWQVVRSNERKNHAKNVFAIAPD